MAWNETTPLVVCDAGPLIHLDELQSLDLLADFEAVYVPEQVWEEVKKHRPQIFLPTYLTLLAVTISPNPSFRTMAQTFSLGLGEQAGLSLLTQYPTAIFLTDDTAARLAATMSGCGVHGTIGILLRAIRRQQRTQTEIILILENIPQQSTLHIRPSLLKEIISQLTTYSPH